MIAVILAIPPTGQGDAPVAGGEVTSQASHEDTTIVAGPGAPVRSSVPQFPPDSVGASDATPEVSPSSGLAYWQAIYRDRLAARVIEIRSEEESWVTDPEAVAAFMASFREELVAAESEDVSPSAQQLADWQLSRDFALREVEAMKSSGGFQAIGADMIYELTPSQLLAFNRLASAARRAPDISDYASFGDLPQESQILSFAPEEVLGHFAPGISQEARDEINILYGTLLQEYLGAEGRVAQLQDCAHEAALGIGLLPPHEDWLPGLIAEVGELNGEVEALQARLSQAYVTVIGG